MAGFVPSLPGPGPYFPSPRPHDSEDTTPPATPEPIETLIAANPFSNGADFSLAEHPAPDLDLWDHRQDQAEWLSPRVTVSNTAEGGSVGTTVSTANSGGASGTAWDVVTIDADSKVTFDDGQEIDTLSYKFDLNSNLTSADNITWNNASTGGLQRSQNQLYSRAYFWISSLPQNTPSGTITIVRYGVSPNSLVELQIDSGGTFRLASIGGASITSIRVPLEQWFRAEVWGIRGDSADPLQTNYIEFRLFKGTNVNGTVADDIATRTNSNTGGIDFSRASFGAPGNGGTGFITIYVDNIAVDTNDWLGPAGTAVNGLAQPSQAIINHPNDVVPPWELEFDFNEPQDQSEWLFPPAFVEPDETFAAQPQPDGFDPLPEPDAFDWIQPQQQNEFLSQCPMLPGMVGWWDFADQATLFQDSALTTPVAADGDPVGGVLDKSGAGNNLTQATAGSRPIFRTAIKNGRSVIELDGLDDFLRNAGLNPNSPMTLIGVTWLDPIPGAPNFTCLFDSDSASPNSFVLFNHGGNNNRWDMKISLDVLTTGGVYVSEWTHLTCVFNGASSAFYNDGALQDVSATDVGSGSPTGFRLGINSALSAATAWDGYIGEFMVYNRVLSPSELEQVWNCIESKWDIGSNEASQNAITHDVPDVVQPWQDPDFQEWEQEVQLNQNEWLSPPAPTETIENLIAAQPAMELDPQPDPDFFQWNQPEEQNEWLSPFVESIENLIAGQPAMELDPQPDPDFFLWEQDQLQNEWLSPVQPETIEVLVGADLFSAGYDATPLEPAVIFDQYEQNTDPPAGTIQPGFGTGDIRRVPRWAKQRNFYAGGR